MDSLRPLLPPNPYLRSLKVDCSRLDDSAIQTLVRPSLHELCLLNCADFSGKLLSEIGGLCKDLRFALLQSSLFNVCEQQFGSKFIFHTKKVPKKKKKPYKMYCCLHNTILNVIFIILS